MPLSPTNVHPRSMSCASDSRSATDALKVHFNLQHKDLPLFWADDTPTSAPNLRVTDLQLKMQCEEMKRTS